MKTVSRVWIGLALSAVAALAQQVISAHSGTIQYVSGDVYDGDRLVESKFGNFPEIKENAVLRTGEGLAEVLLTPGVFLRVGENSSLRMITNRLVDTRLEFLSGRAVIEADDLLKDNSVTLVYRDYTIHLNKKGLYRLDSEPAGLRVFDGEATVALGGETIEVKEGKMLAFGSQLAVAKFDKEATDSLDRWSRRRGQYVAMANVSAANSVRSSGASWLASGWAWNPAFGMFTFIPGSGFYSSPYGYRFWSPFTVYQLYRPGFLYSGRGWDNWGGGGSYGAVPQTRSGYSGVAASAPSYSIPAARAPSSVAGGGGRAPVGAPSHGSSGGARR